MFHAFAVTGCGVCVKWSGVVLSAKSSCFKRPRVDSVAYMDRVRSLLFSSQPDECDSFLVIAGSNGRRVDRVVGKNIAT